MTRRANTRGPIDRPVKRLRQRQRADGTWRIWWEPDARARDLGFGPVELSDRKLGWSERRARELNAEVDRAAATGQRRAQTSPTGRTMMDLIENYRASADFTDRLRPKTRDSYEKNLAAIGAKWGDTLVLDFTKPVVNNWYETLCRQTPSRAVALVRMLSILFARAERIGWRPEGSNPCARLKLRAPDPRDRLATWAELDALVAAADGIGLAPVGTACLIAALSGQRQTDILKATTAEFRMIELDGKPVWVWHLTRSKRGNEGVIKLHPELVDRLRPTLVVDAEALIEDDARPLLIAPGAHRPYDEHLFAKHFARVRAEARRSCRSVSDLQFRDLRRTFATWSMESGTDHQRVGLALGNRLASNARLSRTYLIATLQATAAAVDAIQRPQAPAKKGKHS